MAKANKIVVVQVIVKILNTLLGGKSLIKLIPFPSPMYFLFFLFPLLFVLTFLYSFVTLFCFIYLYAYYRRGLILLYLFPKKKTDPQLIQNICSLSH
jgi:hypothetical protein